VTCRSDVDDSPTLLGPRRSQAKFEKERAVREADRKPPVYVDVMRILECAFELCAVSAFAEHGACEEELALSHVVPERLPAQWRAYIK
jgi:hypothetical protein